MTKDVFNEEYATYTNCEHEILRCIVGSHAYGTSIDTLEYKSDEDFKGIYISPESEVIGITKEQQTKRYGPDDHSYSLRHFAKLATKCVPNVLELLFCDSASVVSATEEGHLLRQNRYIFLSKRCVNPYIGYAQGQLAKSAKVPTNRGIGRQNIVKEYGYDTKFAMHTIRLLQSAEELLRDGELIVRRPNREFLLDIRFGKAFRNYDDFKKFAQDLISKIRKMETISDLQKEPNIDAINKLVIDLQKQYWSNHPELTM